MRAEELGINVRIRSHDRRLTGTESRFAGILWVDHVGEKNSLPADVLAMMFLGGKDNETAHHILAGQLYDRRELERWKRQVRIMHNHLLRYHNHIPILSRAGVNGGYWIAESEAEASAFYDTFRKRGLTGMVKASRGKQAVMVDIVEQLTFEFDELVDKSEVYFPIRPKASAPIAVEVVDAFLERMSQDPEKFADGLRKIGSKYGSILLPKSTVAAMQKKAAELQELVNRL